ncbi:Formylglycine-generating enzyme [Alphaproteobacteria bacterium SO-S41]|nr:Formylglycine-generating enzyme [Alphaproteobacteria bacterium SO-S41]
MTSPHLNIPGAEPIRLTALAGGTFTMGSSNDLYGEAPAHCVVVAPFKLGVTPVTRGQWRAVMGADPSCLPGGDQHPVDSIAWDDAAVFCDRLGGVRLPTEAEWEYACRAGTASDFFFDDGGPYLDETDIPLSVARKLKAYAWFADNSGGGTHPVGLKQSNPFGLHDMIGQLWEWCADPWHRDYDGAPETSARWSDGIESQPRRVLRGGAWDMNAFRCRSSYRSHDHRSQTTDRFGFRVAADP